MTPLPLPRLLYLVSFRGDRPSHYHPTVPWHPVALVASRELAMWHAGPTDKRADVWAKFTPNQEAGGWLRVRWNGLDIDYGHIVRGFPLPDGEEAGIDHDQTAPPWSLLDGAAWWSTLRRIPDWLIGRAVRPSDEFTLQSILSDEHFCCDPETHCRFKARRPW